MTQASTTTDETNTVALLTPTYGRDIDLCTLLCESVDRHVQSFSKHYLLVPDSDMEAFAHLASERRVILPASKFLPKWLRPLPRIIQRKRRQYWWSLRTKPVSGWHIQQFLKIEATVSLPHERFCILDSDVVFFRDFDLTRFQYPSPIPLLELPDEVTQDQVRHAHWVGTSHQLLGLPTPPLPAPDFIGHIIFWDQRTTKAMVAKIEEVTKRNWVDALCRIRSFSEYMLYGFFVQNDGRFTGGHTSSRRTPCISYWDPPQLGQHDLNRLLRGADDFDVAFSVASFSGTPVQSIRTAIDEVRAKFTRMANHEAGALDVVC